MGVLLVFEECQHRGETLGWCGGVGGVRGSETLSILRFNTTEGQGGQKAHRRVETQDGGLLLGTEALPVMFRHNEGQTWSETLHCHVKM